MYTHSSHHVIAWFKEYVICLSEHRYVSLLRPRALADLDFTQPYQMELF